MRAYLQIPLAAALWIAALWLFADALWWTNEQRDLERRLVLAETTLFIGKEEPCRAEIPLEGWQRMNELRVYAWVSACEAKMELEGQ